MKQLKVLIACEESQAVCKAFRELGHNAFSCDIQDCSGGHPEWHIKGDVLYVLSHDIDWDLIIAHPPCTYLSTAATASHSLKRHTNDEIIDRTLERIEAIKFFMHFINYKYCKHIAVENPQGIMSAVFRQPDQYIHPYYFADSIDDTDNYHCKKTGLWLKNLPCLTYDDLLPNPMDKAERWSNGKKKSWTENCHGSVTRSKTFPGIAKAMAEQWSNYILEDSE